MKPAVPHAIGSWFCDELVSRQLVLYDELIRRTVIISVHHFTGAKFTLNKKGHAISHESHREGRARPRPWQA